VIKATAIGQRFRGVLTDFPQRRDRTKSDGSPIINDRGKVSQELVLHLLAMPGTTSVVGKAGEERPVVEGEAVRMIIKGGAFSSWIDAEKAHKSVSPSGARVGDVVEWVIDHAQGWNEDGSKRGPELRSQADADAVPRGVSLGYYGPLTLRAASAAEAEWDDRACRMYRDGNRPVAPAAGPFDGGGADDAPW
jgi:hypothetical protein